MMRALVLAMLLLPVGAGLAGTLLPAFGVLPALGRTEISWAPWRALFALPGVGRAVWLTLSTGVAATVIAFVLVQGFCAAAYATATFREVARMLAPILAVPHAALAIGVAFLVAPSGWVVRLLSPWATGLVRPPDWATVHDPWGAALVAGLVLKEAPFLLLMTLAALNQVPAAATLRVAQSLGYRPATAWVGVVLPLVYPQVRVPVFAVLAFALSVVDVALILGPTQPPTLAVLVFQLFSDPDLAQWFPASAGAVLLLGLVVAAIGFWWVAEFAADAAGRVLLGRGWRDWGVGWPAAGLAAGFGAGLAAASTGLGLLVVWSITGSWRFPEVWPGGWSLAVWGRLVADVAGPFWATMVIAAGSTAAALVGALGLLEAGVGRRATLLLYGPLLVPQIAFLFGWQVVLLRLGVDGTLGAVVWAHGVFVLPYVFLALADPWRAMDPRLVRAAAALGASPWRVFWTVKLAVMRGPVAIAAAVGVAVSVGLYLPTLFAGAGRVATLTTEAVTLAGSADRRVLGVYGVLQAGLPLAAYALALGVRRR